MNQQVLDVSGAFRLLRRRWRIVAVFSLVGLAGTAFYEKSVPEMFSASSLILLPSSASSPGTAASTPHAVTTVARVATSASVLLPAGLAVDPKLALSSLEHRVTTSASATGILKITAAGSTPKQAEELANAVAGHLISFLTTSGVTASSSIVAGLQGQTKQIKKQITDVNDQIAAVKARLSHERTSSTKGSKDKQLLSTLSSEQSTLSLQLDSVRSQIAEAQLAQVADDQGTEVIQRATSATRPRVTALILPMALGAAGGLMAGAIVMLVARRRDPRLHTRDALATAVGTSVVLSLTVPRPRSQKDWVDLFQRYQPAAMELWSVRKALQEVGATGGGRSGVIVIALAADATGIAQAGHVAVAAAVSGIRTVFRVIADDSASILRAACARFEREGMVPRESLELHDGGLQGNTDGERDEAGGGTLFVTVLAVDPHRPIVIPKMGRSSVVVLSISAGFATPEQLARVAIAAADAGEPVAALFVANPDPDDHTGGRPGESSVRASLVEHRRTMGIRLDPVADRLR